MQFLEILEEFIREVGEELKADIQLSMKLSDCSCILVQKKNISSENTSMQFYFSSEII